MNFFDSWPHFGWVILANAVLATGLACLAAGIERRGWRSSLVHSFWLLVILRFLAPPLVPWEVLPTTPSAVSTSATTSATTLRLDDTEELLLTRPVVGPSAVDSSIAVTPELQEIPTLSTASSTIGRWAAHYRTFGGPNLLLLLWALVSLALLVSSLRRVALFMGMARSGTPADDDLQRRTDGLAATLALRKVPEIRLVDDRRLGSPMILSAWGAPQLLLPKALLEDLEACELDTVLVHELAHVRRRDHWVRWPELLAVVVFWWHPVLWWARKSLRRVEERCVDEWVLRFLPGSGRAYAEALLKTLESDSASPFKTPALASGIETMTSMESRLTMILKHREDASRPFARSPWWRWAALPILVTALAVLPTWARPGTGEPPDPDDHHETGSSLDDHHHDQQEVVRHREEIDHHHDQQEVVRHREEIEHQRLRLQERRQHREIELQRNVAQAQRQLAELQSALEQAASQKHSDSYDPEHQERLRFEAVRLKERMDLQEVLSRQETLQMDVESLALDAEVAHLDNDLVRAQNLADRLEVKEKELREQTSQLVERESELHQQELQHELGRHRKERQKLAELGETAELKRLDHQVKRIRLEQRQAAVEKDLHQKQLVLEEQQRAIEAQMQASRTQMSAKESAERAAAEVAIEAEHRQLEAKQRELSRLMIRAEIKMRLEQIRGGLPMEIEELRLALGETDGSTTQEDRKLRAELERLHRELGKVLGSE